jgi:Transposase
MLIACCDLVAHIVGHRRAFLFFCKEEDLQPEEQETLRQLRQASPQLEVAYQLVDDFLHMVRQHTGEQLDCWLNTVETSQLPAFHTFVTAVHKDKGAVLAGLTLPWSTGPVEGQINRLKLIKRESGMVAPSLICSSCACSIKAKRVRTERTRTGTGKDHKRIVRRNRRGGKWRSLSEKGELGNLAHSSRPPLQLYSN